MTSDTIKGVACLVALFLVIVYLNCAWLSNLHKNMTPVECFCETFKIYGEWVGYRP